MLRKFQKQLRITSTNPEDILWNFLRNRKLEGYKFRRQQIIRGYIVDFVCLEKKLIVELDGSHHADQKEKDDARTKILQEDGFHVLRFWNHVISTDVSLALNKILFALEKHPSSGATRHLLPQGEKEQF